LVVVLTNEERLHCLADPEASKIASGAGSIPTKAACFS
jgi:hypothetical protein